MIQLDHHIADFIVRSEERVLLTIPVCRFYEKSQFREEPERFPSLLRSDLPHQMTSDPLRSRVEILERHHFKDRAMVPFLENAELRRFHLTKTGARARLDKLRVIEMLFLVRLRLIEENKIFKISGAFLDESEAFDHLHHRVLGDAAFAIDDEFQMSMTGEACLIRKITEAERCRSLLLVDVIVVQKDSVVRVLEHVRFGRNLRFVLVFHHTMLK